MPGRLGGFLIAAATALVILGASIVPFTTPAFVGFEQSRSGVERFTGYGPAELDFINEQLLGDLFLWRGDFVVADSDLMNVLNEQEQAHMRDVRGVFLGFEILVVASAVVLVSAWRRSMTAEARAATWRAVRRGARALAIGLAVAGFFAVFAFDAAFEVFHRLFFSNGTFTFDPRTDRLVQLFPEQFWSETAIAVGLVAIVAALATAWLAGRRAGAARPATVFAPSRAGS